MIRWQPGEARTRIVIARQAGGTDAEGYPCPAWTPITAFPIPCRWINVHGREVYDAQQLKLSEPATIVLRYCERIDPRCRVWRAGDPQDDKHAYEIISIDNVREMRRLLEIKIKRVVEA